MWHYAYTQQWFEKVAQGVPLEHTYFVMVLMQELDRGLKQFLEDHYKDLAAASSIPLQIFAPMKPPSSISGDAFGPDNPMENHEERQMFLSSIKEAGISLHDLPKLLFFTLKRSRDDEYEFSNVRSLSLRTIEHGRSSSTTYKELFSRLIGVATDCYHDRKPAPEFYSRVSREFKLRFFEEKVAELPVLGRVYKKKLDSVLANQRLEPTAPRT